MTTRNLERMFSPDSIALIGASNQEKSVGKTVMNNLFSAGFKGPVWLVNPHHREIEGRACYPNIGALPDAPDLAVIATPPGTIPGLIRDLGEKGVRAAVVITAGIGNDEILRQAWRRAHQHGL